MRFDIKDKKQRREAIFEKNLKDRRGVFGQTETAVASFAKFTDSAKLYALDAIYEQAKTVYGPYGGSYIIGNVSKETNEILLRKSTDGHNFFNNIQYPTVFVATVLGLIREKTYHVTNAVTDTSRDGTTSLALLSVAAARNVIARRLFDFENSKKIFKVPSAVTRVLLNTMSNEFVKLVNKYKIEVYDNNTFSYASPKLRQHAIDAISTTTGGNAMFTDEYVRFMDFCVENKIDLTSAFRTANTSNIESSENSFTLAVNKGIKLDGRAINKATATYFQSEDRLLFLLDGFMSDEAAQSFDIAFRMFLKNLLHTLDSNGLYLFSKHNPNGMKPPVFLYTRSNEHMVRLFRTLENAFKVKMKTLDGEIIEETIRPVFIHIDSETEYENIYNLVRNTFVESVIDLNAIRRYVFDSARKELTKYNESMKDSPIKKHKGADAEDIRPWYGEFATDILAEFFPSLEEALPSIMSIEEVLPIAKYAEVEIGKPEANSFTEDSNLTIRRKELYIRSLVFNMTFDGTNIFISPNYHAVKNRLDERTAECVTALNNTTPNTMEWAAAKKLVNGLTSCTITPIIRYTTKDDLDSMFDTYQDAQGCFESIHSFGVLPGSNTFIFKVLNEFLDNTSAEVGKINEEYVNCSKLYREIMESIVLGYAEVYKDLLHDEEMADEFIVMYTTSKEETLLNIYNIYTNGFDDHVIEPAKTTVDIFTSITTFLYDMLTVKSVYLDNDYEWNALTKDFSDVSYSKVNAYTANRYGKYNKSGKVE